MIVLHGGQECPLHTYSGMSTPTQVLAELENLEIGDASAAEGGADGGLWVYGVAACLGPLAFGAVESWSGFVDGGGGGWLLMVGCARGPEGVRGARRIQRCGGIRCLLRCWCLLDWWPSVGYGLTSYRYVTWTSALLFSGIDDLCFLLTQSLAEGGRRLLALGIVVSVYGDS